MPTTWWVATTGSNTTGDGSQGNPYATAQKAHDVGAAGDTINVLPGTYAATLTVTKNNLTVNGYGGKARFYGATAVGGNAWALDSGNIWKKTGVTMSGAVGPLQTNQSLIFVNLDGTFTKGWQMDAKVEIDSVSTVGRKFFYDIAGTTLYVYSTSDPTTAFSAVHQTQTRGAAGVETGTYGGIYDTSTGLKLNDIEVFGWWGNGYLGYLCTTFTATRCSFSYNSEDGAGGHGGTNPIVERCEISWNGARRMRDNVAFLDIGTDGDGWSWHKTTTGTQSTGIQDNYCVYDGNCKDAFQHINQSTATSHGARIFRCNLGVVFYTDGACTQTMKNARIFSSSTCIAAVGFNNAGGGTARIYNCTLVGSLRAAYSACITLTGGPAIFGNCVVRDFVDVWANPFAVGTFTEDYNVFSTTPAVANPAVLGAHTVTTNPLLDANYGVPRTSPCWVTGNDYSAAGVTTDAVGRMRPTVPTRGALEPYGAGHFALQLAAAIIGD